MRKIGLTILVLLFMVGCSKNKNANPLIGTWELRQTSGGWTGITNYQPGNGNTVTFRDDNQYTRKVVTHNTSYTLLYKYSIVKSDECRLNLAFMSSSNMIENKQQYSIVHDSLFMSDGSCIADGGSSIYIKK